jgi:mono/diheme cytochrome c family protein
MISDRSFSLAILVCITLFATVFIMGLSGCGPKGNEPNIEIIQNMMDQPAVKAQDYYDLKHPDKSGMLVPPEGTAAMNREVYLYKGNPEAAEKNLVNPYAKPSPEIIALGEKNFKNFCFVCHGPGGQGDGPVGLKFQGVKPPSLMSDKVRNFKDGRIFHIITDGQGVMGTYINHMPFSKDRWAVVAYVRKLQRDTK